MKIKEHIWPIAVFTAIMNILASLLGKKIPGSSGYWNSLLIAIDLLGNAFAGGNPKVTISARVGYQSHVHAQTGNQSLFWEGCESLIDFTFKPIDGYDHCWKAYNWTTKTLLSAKRKKLHINHGPDFMLGVLAIITAVACLILIPITYSIGLIKR